MFRRTVILCSFLALTGCSTTLPPWPAADLRDPNCVQLYQEMDQAVANADVRNAAGEPIDGFPYLRVNRFLADMASRLETSEDGDLWLQQTSQFDLQLRFLEYRTLPPSSDFKQKWDHEGIFQDHLTLCTGLLAGTDRNQPDFWGQMVSRSRVPDDYIGAYRVPLYPLTVLPVAVLTERARDTFTDWFATPWEQQANQGTLIRYTPDYRPSLNRQQRQAILSRSANNRLEWPLPSREDTLLLLASLAPELYVDQTAPYDKIVSPVWQGEALEFDNRNTPVYTYLSHTWWQGRPLLQLNYSFWYSAREGDNAPWIEKGPLDGMTIRLTLLPDGRIGLIDLMNSCGCYHAAFPGPQMKVKPREEGLKPGLFSPIPLPKDAEDGFLRLRINSGWHQITQISDQSHASDQTRPYQLRPYEELEALPVQDHYRSLFRPDGVARGSERIEYLLLFSLGVPDVGSMRQRGNHPISLIGRDHFDDPDFLERYFIPESVPEKN